MYLFSLREISKYGIYGELPVFDGELPGLTVVVVPPITVRVPEIVVV